MNQLLAELRRRNVFRVAAAYLVGSWLVLQIVGAIETSAGLPDWTDGMALVLLVIGLPIALIVAWAFELTPEGMKKTEEAEGEVAIRPLGGTDFVLIGLMVVVLGMIGFQIMRGGAAPVARPIAQTPRGETSVSIAVLPFVDLSEGGDQEYFSDGISEEILNVLVRIPELGVAGRTSSFAFKGRNEDLRVIGDALGVNHVLEGSVRRSGERLRITAQLIRASDGFHIWSETYDRDLIDIFAIQDEIALAVAEQLAVSLGLNRESLSRSTTTNIEAYEAFLRARPLFLLRGDANLHEAIVLLNHSIALDPDFAPAWTTLAGVYSVLEYYVDEATIEQKSQWRNAGTAVARRAIDLAPNSGEAHANLGVLLALDHDWEVAFQSLDRAVELAPNDPAVLDAVAQRLADIGYIEQATALARRVVEIEPLVAIYRSTLGYAYSLNPSISDEIALEQLRIGNEIDPNFPFLYSNLFNVLYSDGRREEASELLETVRAAGALLDGDYTSHRALNDAWGESETAVRAVAADLPPFYAMTAGIILDDMDMVLDFFTEYSAIEIEGDVEIAIIYDGDYTSDPRWKTQVVRDGLLDLWRVRGFPAGCHAFPATDGGDDDFECDWRPSE